MSSPELAALPLEEGKVLGPLAKQFLQKRTVKLLTHGPMRFEEIHEHFTRVFPLNAIDLRRVLADMVAFNRLALNEQGRYEILVSKKTPESK